MITRNVAHMLSKVCRKFIDTILDMKVEIYRKLWHGKP